MNNPFKIFINKTIPQHFLRADIQFFNYLSPETHDFNLS
jgi:hypothetical protein